MTRGMRIIARREFASYVMTWGFWISMLFVPVFMLLGAFAPLALRALESERYVAVVADDPALERAFLDADDRQFRARGRDIVEALARLPIATGDAETALTAYDGADTTQAGVSAAIEALGLPANAADQSLDALSSFTLVDPPARTPEALRPYLLGEQTIDTDDGPQTLNAAVILTRDADGAVTADLWSEQVTLQGLEGRVRRAASAVMSREALLESGVDPSVVERATDLRATVRNLTPQREGDAAEVGLADRLPVALGFVMGFGLWVVIFSVVNMLVSSTIEEKANKILDALLATTRLWEILAGKLLGIALVSLTFIAVWGGAAFVAIAISVIALGSGDASLLGALSPGMVAAFVVYFALGYLLYGAIFMAIGSLCDSLQEAQTLLTPMFIVMMIPMFGLFAAARDPESSVIGVMSWIPIYTPFMMMVRLPNGVPAWEIGFTTALLAATTIGVLFAAGGLFKLGVVDRVTPATLRRALGLGGKAKSAA